MGTQHPNRLTQEIFYRLCEKLKTMEKTFRASRPTYTEAARTMSELLGHQVNHDGIRRACNATGVEWDRPAPVYKNRKAEIVILATAVRQLFESLGTAVPPEVLSLCSHPEDNGEG